MSENFFDDFLKMFPDDEDSPLDEEYYAIEDEFYELFGHRAPREIIPLEISDEQIKEAMKLCIKNKEDALLKLLNVENPDNAWI